MKVSAPMYCAVFSLHAGLVEKQNAWARIHMCYSAWSTTSYTAPQFTELESTPVRKCRLLHQLRERQDSGMPGCLIRRVALSVWCGPTAICLSLCAVKLAFGTAYTTKAHMWALLQAKQTKSHHPVCQSQHWAAAKRSAYHGPKQLCGWYFPTVMAHYEWYQLLLPVPLWSQTVVVASEPANIKDNTAEMSGLYCGCTGLLNSKCKLMVHVFCLHRICVVLWQSWTTVFVYYKDSTPNADIQSHSRVSKVTHVGHISLPWLRTGPLKVFRKHMLTSGWLHSLMTRFCKAQQKTWLQLSKISLL